jgi:hypothetical protein
VRTHPRHFAQKAWYTTATVWDPDGEEHRFRPHEEVFEHPLKNQDLLFKITIPMADRLKALSELDEYNINHFTLFQSEDSLVKTMAIRQFDLKKQ